MIFTALIALPFEAFVTSSPCLQRLETVNAWKVEAIICIQYNKLETYEAFRKERETRMFDYLELLHIHGVHMHAAYNLWVVSLHPFTFLMFFKSCTIYGYQHY